MADLDTTNADDYRGAGVGPEKDDATLVELDRSGTEPAWVIEDLTFTYHAF